MSRETDSSSSGPQGRGGAAYPSGTPPYGSRPFPSLHPQEGAQGSGSPAGQPVAPPPEEPRTETTLTTRIRINIPGSRPIPPVVVRTPVEEAAKADNDEDTGSGPLPDWATLGAGAAGGAVTGAGGGMAGPVTEEPAAGPEAEKASDWFAPRKPPVASSPAPAESAAPAPPASPLGASPLGAAPMGPSVPRTRTPEGGAETTQPISIAELSGPDAARGTAPSAPIGSAAPYPAPPMGASPGTGHAPPPVGGPEPFPTYQPPASPTGPGPDGPTTGPVTGGMQMPAGQAAPSARVGYRPGGTGAGPVPGAPRPHGSGARVSGDTLVSGIPAVPSTGPRPPKPVTADDAYRFEAADRPEAQASKPQPKATSQSKPQPASKGRSKAILAGVGLVGLVGIAYGAGLLMDHADVPKGTTVLGVGIGGLTRDEAVRALDAKLGTRAAAPLKVRIGDRETELKPSVAGLGIDTQATVRGVAHADYNPVSVIGSLFGISRQADPVMIEDDEKLKAALANLSDRTGGGAGADGTVRFVSGKAVGVPGKPHEALDVDGSVKKVADAFRRHAETGGDQTIELAVTTQQPKVTQAEIDRAIKEFGDPAMSGLVTVRTDAAHSISFGPAKSLPKFLSMVPDSTGHLTPHFDLAVLKELYGNVFNGVLLERGDGSRTPVKPEDVAGAMLPALKETSAAKRIAIIPNVAK